MQMFFRARRAKNPAGISRPDAGWRLRSAPVWTHPTVAVVVAADPHSADVGARIVVGVVRRISVGIELGTIRPCRIVDAAADRAGAGYDKCNEAETAYRFHEQIRKWGLDRKERIAAVQVYPKRRDVQQTFS